MIKCLINKTGKTAEIKRCPKSFFMTCLVNFFLVDVLVRKLKANRKRRELSWKI